jgi:MvdD pre-ATP grasp domain
MLLIVTNKQDYTADFLILGLKTAQIPFVRFNTEDFPNTTKLTITLEDGLLSGILRTEIGTYHLHDFTSVWYRRPISPVPHTEVNDPVAREFIMVESHEMLENVWRLLPCFWVSRPDQIRIAERRLLQLKTAAEVGLATPPTIVTNEPEQAQAYFVQHPHLVYKPLRHARIDRGEIVGLIYTNVVLPTHHQALDTVQFAPVQFQPYIPKQTEVRVVVIGQQVFAVELQSQHIAEAQHDWRRVDISTIPHVQHELPPEIANKCVALVRSFGLQFSAMDLILTPDDRYVFLDLNPNGQWAWIQRLCPDIGIREALIALLCGTHQL